MKNLEISISLKCYVCGNDQFSIVDEKINDVSETLDDTEVKCSDCGRIVSKEQLIKENSHIIDVNIEDFKKEATKEIEKEVKKAFEKWN